MSQIHKFIYDEEELARFINLFPDLQQDEVFYLCLFMRNKALTPEEKTQYAVPRSGVIRREVLRTKEDLLIKLRGFETQEGVYTSKKSGLPLPTKALVPYFTICPVSSLKAYSEFNRIFTEYLIELNRANDKTEVWYKINKANTLLMDCYQHAYSKKIYLDIDVDVLDKEFEAIEQFDKALITKGVRFAKIETKGGFHYLVLRESLSFNYNILVSALRERVKEHENREPDIWKNPNHAIPIPGCYQYGDYPVKIVFSNL